MGKKHGTVVKPTLTDLIAANWQRRLSASSLTSRFKRLNQKDPNYQSPLTMPHSAVRQLELCCAIHG
jgi:hypothetical protein